MVTVILSLLAYLIPFLLDAWKAGSPQRQEEQSNAQIQQGRTDIDNGNTDAVIARIDSVPAPASGSAPRLGDDQDTARRLAEITGDAGMVSER